MKKRLTETNSGDRGIISDLHGDSHFLCRITSIGLTRGCPVEVLQNENKQPLLIYGRDTMIALNRTESEKIILEVMA